MAPPHAELFDRELDYITVLLFVKLLRRDGVLNAGCQSRGNVPSICSTRRASWNHGTANCLAEICARAPDLSIGNVGESVGKQTRKDADAALILMPAIQGLTDLAERIGYV